jgi:hypothetical protein
VRLTLRTLLAYLDDTLEPAQAKLIGQKVAESDTARELIERIKQVTRRRRLAAPPTAGPGGNIDPNTIAEYLDNEVTPEQSAEVEQVCLASDVHLAEVAACHQILTLVLGEPALVPPTAKQRMYTLVKGKEAIQSRKAPKSNMNSEEAALQESSETDLTLRLGLPPFRMNADMKQRLFLWGGGILAALLLVVAMWQLLGSNRDGDELPPSPPVAVNAGKEDEEKARLEQEKTAKAKKNLADKIAREKEAKLKEAKERADKDKAVAEKKKQAFDKFMDVARSARKDKKIDDAIIALESALEIRPGDKEAMEELEQLRQAQTQPTFQPVFLDIPAAPPSQEETIAGIYVAPPENAPSVLLQDFGKTAPEWKRIDLKNSDVVTARPLVSLPGFRSAVDIPGGLKLTLWGIVPELWPSSNPVALRLFESFVILHRPATTANGKADLDLTLRRGRITLATTRGDRPTRIRLRYHNPAKKDKLEFVDISLLDKDSEVLIERSCLPYFLTGFEPSWKDLKHPDRLGPVANLALVALSGRIQVKVKELTPLSLEPPPGRALVVWNNRRDQFDQSQGIPDLPPDFLVSPKLQKDAEVRAAMRRACAELNGRLSGKDLDDDLREATASADPALRQLSIRVRGALDQIDELVERLRDKNKDVVRTAIRTLEYWIVQDRDNDHLLWPKLRKRFGGEGEKITELLHGESRPELLSDYLKNSPSAILREMAQLRVDDLAMLQKLMPPKK